MLLLRNIVAPTGLKEVLVPSWSDQWWQDDLIWHKATRQADGSYRVTIKASEHKNAHWQVQCCMSYYVDDSNQRHYISEKDVDVRQSYANCFIND